MMKFLGVDTLVRLLILSAGLLLLDHGKVMDDQLDAAKRS
jgi:hypothetical protein